jgi:hypothetical protein
MPDPFTFGNAGRNIVDGPGFANVDVVVQRNLRVARAVSVELRWEVFNLTNRANFSVPNRIAFTPNFGRIFSAGSPRQMQFGAKVTF